MSKNYIFILIKPDGVKRNLVGEIIKRFEQRDFKLKNMYMIIPDRDLIETHYEEHKEKTFYNTLIDFTCSGHVIPMVWEGDLQVARQIIGDTIPYRASSGTIRGDYSSTLPENLVHCSKTQHDANREIALWFNN